ncbi:MAG: FAD/NAD(P)-binding protein [Candidatus Diapherotrites archaeon]|nr:FAD/NAD(P)-binding protein [Candidatus Diapherotrites archaeon]
MENKMLPTKARVIEIIDETNNIKTFRLELIDDEAKKKFFFFPGKFVMVSIFGYGEIPLGISSSHHEKRFFEVSVAKVGNTSSAMHNLKIGDIVGIRGPFGRAFPYMRMKGKDILIVAGGTGIAPLRCLVNALLDERESFGKIWLIYGTKNKNSFCYTREINKWKESGKINIVLTTDEKCEDELICHGLVTDYLDKTDLDYKKTTVALCGPEKMIENCAKKLISLGVNQDDIFVSLERLMFCGFGKCMHCNISTKYACIEGPVFTLNEVLEMKAEA